MGRCTKSLRAIALFALAKVKNSRSIHNQILLALHILRKATSQANFTSQANILKKSKLVKANFIKLTTRVSTGTQKSFCKRWSLVFNLGSGLNYKHSNETEVKFLISYSYKRKISS